MPFAPPPLNKNENVEEVAKLFVCLKAAGKNCGREIATHKPAREILYFFCKTEARMNKYKKHPQSRAAKELLNADNSAKEIKGKLITDHSVPFNEWLYRRLDDDTEYTCKEWEAFIEQYHHIYVITADENEKLNCKGLEEKMPRGWDGNDIFARYKAVGIEF